MRDAYEAEVDGLADRVRVWLVGVVAGVAPVWLLFTVTVAQIHPELQAATVVLDETGELLTVTELSPLGRFARAGVMVAAWLALAGLILTPVVAGIAWLQRRQAATRGPAGASVLDDDLVDGASWSVLLKQDERRAGPPVEVEGPTHDVSVSEVPAPARTPTPLTVAQLPLGSLEDEDTEETLDHLFE